MNIQTLALVLVLVGLVAGTCHAGNTLNLSVDKMGLSFNSGTGFSLSYAGVSIIKESTLWVHSPSWTTHYYGFPEGKQEVTVKEIEGGKEAVITHATPSFEGRHLITMTKNKVTLEFRYKLLAKVDADMENCLGYVSASPIQGCSYHAETGNGVTDGVVPLVPKAAEMEKTLLSADPFKKLTIDSRLGKLTFEVSGDPAGLSIFDARKNPMDWAIKSPVFWCGVLGTTLQTGKEYTQTVSISVDPGPEREKPLATSVGGDIFPADIEEARAPASGPVLVIPEPKQMKGGDADFPLSEKTQLVVAEGAKAEDFRGAQSFAEEVKALYDLDLAIVTESQAAESGVILVGEAARNKALAGAAKAEKLSAPDKEEGYAVKATAERVLVLGHDPRGSFYGMQTLKQLVKSTPKALTIQGCEISDYPSLKYRGVHLFTGNQALPFHQKMVDRILSRYKMNSLLLECDYIQWKSAPKLAVDFSMSQDDLKKDIAYARDHFMEVSPLVQSLGHGEWMFTNGQNRDLAEDPDHPYAYCASNPKTYDFITKIYDEAVDLFDHPRYFHIGHDEVTGLGQFPNDAQCKKKSVGDLFVGDVLKIHDHLKKKGARVMMWGDMLLAPGESPDATNAPTKEEARRRRDLLPKDIIFADWHYAPSDPGEFHSARILQDEGFGHIAATWYTPANIANYAAAEKKNNGGGLLQTTWAGYNSRETNLNENFDQFTAFILAAEFAWNSGATSLENLPYQPAEEFRRQWSRTKPDRATRKGFVIDLAPLCNVKLADNPTKTDWIGLGPDGDLSAVPAGDARLKGDLFRLAKPTDYSAIRLTSALDGEIAHPKSAEFPVLRRAEAIVFLQTCAWPDTPGREVGGYTVRYNDGTTAEIKLIYGSNLAAWTDNRACPNAEIVWSGQTKLGQKVSLRRLEWRNPNPDKLITQIVFHSNNAEAGPALLAVTGISPRQY